MERNLQPESLFPGRRLTAGLRVERHRAAHVLGRGPNRHVGAERAHPVERILGRADEVVAEPVLPLPRLIDDVEEIGARGAHLFVP
jgi:hypothetical protein